MSYVIDDRGVTLNFYSMKKKDFHPQSGIAYQLGRMKVIKCFLQDISTAPF